MIPMKIIQLFQHVCVCFERPCYSDFHPYFIIIVNKKNVFKQYHL